MVSETAVSIAKENADTMDTGFVNNFTICGKSSSPAHQVTVVELQSKHPVVCVFSPSLCTQRFVGRWPQWTTVAEYLEAFKHMPFRREGMTQHKLLHRLFQEVLHNANGVWQERNHVTDLTCNCALCQEMYIPPNTWYIINIRLLEKKEEERAKEWASRNKRKESYRKVNCHKDFGRQFTVQ